MYTHALRTCSRVPWQTTACRGFSLAAKTAKTSRHFYSGYYRSTTLAATAVALVAAATFELATDPVRSEPASTVPVAKGIDDIPIQLCPPSGIKYSLLGHGMREVSFLKFRVYALGVYIAQDDTEKARTVFNSPFMKTLYEDQINNEKDSLNNETVQEHHQHVYQALLNPSANHSAALINACFDAGVKFTARICAMRNTDMAHLRDGFIRTIRSSPHYSEIQKSNPQLGEQIDKGLDDLRDIFNAARRTAKKNSLLYVELDDQQRLHFTLETTATATKSGITRNTPIDVGIVGEPLVGRLLFEAYLGATKPLVPGVQQTAAASLAALVA